MKEGQASKVNCDQNEFSFPRGIDCSSRGWLLVCLGVARPARADLDLLVEVYLGEGIRGRLELLWPITNWGFLAGVSGGVSSPDALSCAVGENGDVYDD